MRVQAILRRTAAENQIARPDQMTIGDLTLHCLSYQLDVGSKTVRLTVPGHGYTIAPGA